MITVLAGFATARRRGRHVAPPKRWWIYILATLPAHIIVELGVGMGAAQLAIAFITNVMVAVINAAAYTDVDRAESEQPTAFAVNAEGPARLAAETGRRGIPLVHISTDYVFDGRKGSPYVESDPPAPLNAYGRSKLAGEEAVVAGNPRHVILRTSWVYSPFRRNFVRTILRLASGCALSIRGGSRIPTRSSPESSRAAPLPTAWPKDWPQQVSLAAHKPVHGRVALL